MLKDVLQITKLLILEFEIYELGAQRLFSMRNLVVGKPEFRSSLGCEVGREQAGEIRSRESAPFLYELYYFHNPV